MRLAEHDLYFRMGSDYFSFSGKRHLLWALAAPFLSGNSPSSRILDIGCGPGHAFGELQAWGQVVGIDMAQEALLNCRKARSGEAKLIRACATDLPCADDTFSAVVALDVFEHLEEDERALSECRRVLKPGGHLLLTVPAFEWLWGDHDDWNFHRRRYQVKEMRQKLARAGFNVVRLTYFQAILVAPLWLFRTAKRWFPQCRGSSDLVPVPRWLNSSLRRILTSEAFFLRRWNLPVGVSILGIARKVNRTPSGV